MSPLKASWNHTICEVCWFKREPLRFPVQVKREEGSLEVSQCCFCDSLKVTMIFVRQDPNDPVLRCGGQHDEENDEEEIRHPDPEPGVGADSVRE